MMKYFDLWVLCVNLRVYFLNLMKMRKLFTKVACAVSLLAVSVPVGANAVESVRQDAGVAINDVRRDKRPASTRRMETSSVPVMPVMKAEQYTGGNVKVTIMNNADWGDGTGYQLLLDADAEIYDLIDWVGEDLQSIYDDCEYKLPETASPTSDWVLPFETKSMEIPAGTYDFVVANPYPVDNKVYTANGPGALADDFTFLAGVEYVFTIGWTEDNKWDYCEMSVVAPVEIGIEELVSPVTGELTATEEVSVVLVNNGTSAVSGVELSLSVDGSEPVREVCDEEIAAGAKIDYVFNAKADLSALGRHTISIVIDVENDANSANNNINAVVVNAVPVTPPFVCDFNTESSFVDNWDVINANDDGQTWYFNDYRADSGVAALEYSLSYLDSDDYLVTLRPVALPAGSAYFVFDYAGFQDGYDESFEILYGTTSDVEQMTLLKEFDCTQKAVTTDSISLEITERGNYYFAIHGTSVADQFGLWIDNVKIGTNEEFSGVGSVGSTSSVLTLYPNPASEMIAVAAGQEIVSIGIYSISGVQVATVAGNGGSEIRCDVSGFSSGVYFARVKTTAGIEVLRFVVK